MRHVRLDLFVGTKSVAKEGSRAVCAWQTSAVSSLGAIRFAQPGPKCYPQLSLRASLRRTERCGHISCMGTRVGTTDMTTGHRSQLVFAARPHALSFLPLLSLASRCTEANR